MDGGPAEPIALSRMTGTALSRAPLFQRVLCTVAALAGFVSSGASPDSSVPHAANEQIVLVFGSASGSLQGVFDPRTGHQFIDVTAPPPLWELAPLDDTKAPIVPEQARGFTWVNGDGEVRLSWEGFENAGLEELRIEATVTLSNDSSESRWRLRIDGLRGTPLGEIRFPRIGNIAPQEREVLAVPVWIGELARDPRSVLADKPQGRITWDYPGSLSMQCVTVYRDNGPGIFVATRDPATLTKRFAVTSADNHGLSLEVCHVPGATNLNDVEFEIPYETVVGTFEGDWFTAAERYRAWATRQPWATSSRFHQGFTPDWVEHTGIWVWNRGRSPGVLGPAARLQEAGLPVSVFWHWWHGCPYDVGFPEYFPPREGAESFRQALESAHERGLHAIVYMNQRLWGMTTSSWTAENAERFAVKAKDGKIHPEIYNTFTKSPCAAMCIATPFWREKYAGLAAAASIEYRVDGIYMDQACLSLPCYDPSHGHPIGGGNYWIDGFRALANDIRARCAGIALAGEGCGEAWLPHLDLMLALQVSKERYSGPNRWEPIPFFQAVYGGRALLFGNYSSLTMPPYDELWPAEFAPKEPLKLLDRKFAAQFRLEQARAFAWGQQPTIANFLPSQLEERAEEIAFVVKLAKLRRAALKYLERGTMLPPPRLNVPDVELDMSRLSIYAGQQGGLREFRGQAPAVIASAWQAEDGDAALVLVNISNEPRELSLAPNRPEYRLGPKGAIYQLTDMTRDLLGPYREGDVAVPVRIPARDAVILEFTRS